eukprot:TRINITY_DN5191_c0_g1_i1.p1 TRINITY_DN5191_c0_g1~~TRINITY_DN5191_c0_g1_i1.p1  ORF type:complete len:133 (+),score=23.34 TRINITY_DN5191_c0_g1_i1:55-453(+)
MCHLCEVGVDPQSVIASRDFDGVCTPCEDPNVVSLDRDVVECWVKKIPGWEASQDGTRIRRRYVMKSFVDAVSFFQRVAQLAEAAAHHPDLHLEEYNNVSVELWTHSKGGVTENDFILANHISRLPVQTQAA